MAIHVNEAAGVFTLQTEGSTYQMKADSQRTLLHLYYGRKTGDFDKSYCIYYADHGFSGNPFSVAGTDRTYSKDTLPQEYSCFGTGDYRISALMVRNADGTRAADLVYDSYELLPGKYSIPGLPAVYASEEEAQTLVITLRDPATELRVRLYYGILEKYDVITRAAEIFNGGSGDVVIEKSSTMTLDFQSSDMDLMTFYGRHAMERSVQRQRIGHGMTSVGSVRGASGHQYSPFSILCAPETTEDQGSCYGFHFVYSGEFLTETEKDQYDTIRFQCGLQPAGFAWKLAPGESFHTPEVIMCYNENGFAGLSRKLHHLINEHVVRGEGKLAKRPILINNWEGTYFNFTGDKLAAIAKDAAELGIEMFVMDDGWFGKRDRDVSGLGDWYPNEKKLGCTLKELGERITALGLKFGIWFEPEMINMDSDLYRAHPDWAVQIPGRQPNLGRFQLLLDISRTEVQDYIIERLSDVLGSAPISYVKWDFNRSMCDKYTASLPADRQGEMTHRFYLGLYRILETLLQRFPHLLLQGCSGGGGRFDAGMLYYSPDIWCSDDSDAIERLEIQYGTSFGFPVSSMGAHVSASPNHQTGRLTPFSTRATVAMAGTFGYELDLNKLTEEEREEVKREIRVFRENAELLQYGDYYRLSSPKSEICTAWEMVSPDGSKAIVNAVFHHTRANSPAVRVHLKGLVPEAMYEIKIPEESAELRKIPIPMVEGTMGHLTDGTRIDGASLMDAGINIPAAFLNFASQQFILLRVEE